jgi:hypothetical protein
MTIKLLSLKTLLLMLLIGIRSIGFASAGNALSADGKNTNEIVSGAESFLFSFEITKAAAAGANELKGPLKIAAKANGGMELSYYFTLSLLDASTCENINTLILNEPQTVKADGWAEVAKSGPQEISIESQDIYRSLIDFSENCSSLSSGFELEAKLVTQPKASMKDIMAGKTSDELHVLSSFTIPVSGSTIGELKSDRYKDVYKAYLSGGWSDKTYEPQLKSAIIKKLGYEERNVLVNIESFTYTNIANTTLNWYAYDMYRSSDETCQYGYIYGEAAVTSSGYSITRINGERHQLIDCSYLDKLKAQER